MEERSAQVDRNEGGAGVEKELASFFGLVQPLPAHAKSSGLASCRGRASRKCSSNMKTSDLPRLQGRFVTKLWWRTDHPWLVSSNSLGVVGYRASPISFSLTAVKRKAEMKSTHLICRLGCLASRS